VRIVSGDVIDRKKCKTRGKYILISSNGDHSHGWLSGNGRKDYSLDYIIYGWI
jgi:hypothetical protein